MTHDYDLPPEWSSMSDIERSERLTAERCRRQALRQSTAMARRLEKAQERHDRRADARAETVNLDDYR